MLCFFRVPSILASVLIASVSLAQAPAVAPPGSTGQCRDGSYWSGAVKKGACRGHQGVQTWYGATDAASGTAGPGTGTAAPATAASAAAAPPANSPAPTAAAKPTAPAPAAAAAAGGGPGQVWVNSASKVYHCPTDRWYGKTKQGQYMSESDAIAQGNHADHGKACAK